jgi:acid phosphatase family membrane protein YuiD
MGILGILNNDVLIVALSSWLVAQIAKIVINAIVTKEFNLERLFGDGGMPSGHSATVTAAALMTGICAEDGFASPVFGLALVFAIVVMHDATGVRQEAGKHARYIIEIVEVLNEYLDYLVENDEKVKVEKLKTLVGHTHLQVFFGALTGIIVVILYLWIFGKFDMLITAVA